MKLRAVGQQPTRPAHALKLPANDFASVFSQQPTEAFAADQAIFWEGDEAKHVFLVAGGMVRALRLLADGRRVIVGFLRAGDLLGVSLKERYIYTVEALTTVTVRRVPRCRFDDELARQPRLREQLFSRLCDEMSAAQDQTVLVSRRSADERIAAFLQLMAGSGAVPRVVDLPMSRLDIADYLGMTIETVSRTITRLASAGIISPPGRRSIEVLRPEALRALARGEGFVRRRSPATPGYRHSPAPARRLASQV